MCIENRQNRKGITGKTSETCALICLFNFNLIPRNVLVCRKATNLMNNKHSTLTSVDDRPVKWKTRSANSASINEYVYYYLNYITGNY